MSQDFWGLEHQHDFKQQQQKYFPQFCSRNILTKPSIAHFSSFNLLTDVWEGALMRYMWSISRASWLLYTPVEYSF